MSVEEFLREFHHSLMLGAHQNILTVFPDMVFSLEGQCCMFASEYAPLGKRQFQSYPIHSLVSIIRPGLISYNALDPLLVRYL